MSYGSPMRGAYQGGYQGSQYSDYYAQSTPGSSGGRKRFRGPSSSLFGPGRRLTARRADDDAGYPDERGPQRRFNDYSSPRGGRGRGRGGFRGGGYRAPEVDFEQQTAAAEERFCKTVWRLGDSDRFDFRNEIPGVVRAVEGQWSRDPKPVFKAFRVAPIELPHKLPHYAIVLAMLATSRPGARPQERQVHTATGVTVIASGDADAGAADPVSIGQEVVKDLIKSFQSHLDGRRWRSTRLTLSLLAHLAALPSPLISKSSLVAVLTGFAGVWEELTGTASRADECFKVVAEVLLRAGSIADGTEEVDAVLSAAKAYAAGRKLDRGILGDEALADQYDDPIEDLAAALGSSSPILTCLPTLAEPFAPELEARATASAYPDPLDLPGILVPPDRDDEDGLGVGAVNGGAANGTSSRVALGRRGPVTPDQKDRMGPFGAALCVKVFVDETTPPKTSPDGVLIRSLLADIIDIFEVNRKECAAVLLDLPRWFARGTFRRANQAPPAPQPQTVAEKSETDAGDANGDQEMKDQEVKPDEVTDVKPEEVKPEEAPPAIVKLEEPKLPYWVLESCIVEAIFTAMLSLPSSPRKPVYYHSLVAELCRLAPQTIAPALGKCVRRLFASAGQLGPLEDAGASKPAALEAEGIARFAEWFAVHLSNFGFMWGWKDWQEHLALPVSHPKRQFMARTLELETRLSYFDRIKGTVPETFVDAGIISASAPSAAYDYETEANEHHLAAADIVLLMRRKEPAARLTEYISKMKERLQQDPICLTEARADSTVLDVVVQVLLSIGSRSFSHFLNVFERYLALVKELVVTPGAKAELLATVAHFWRRNPQFCLIVVDKLVDYRVVDPVDAVVFAFTGPVPSSGTARGGWAGVFRWNVVQGAVETAKVRVTEASKRVDGLRRREELKAESKRAADGAADVDMDRPEGEKADDAPATADEPATTQDELGRDRPAEVAAVSELATAEEEARASVSDLQAVLCEVVRRFRETSSVAVDGEDEEAMWQRWWAVGWFKAFARTYATELAKHSDAVGTVELAEGSVVKSVVEQAQAWADYAGQKA